MHTPLTSRSLPGFHGAPGLLAGTLLALLSGGCEQRGRDRLDGPDSGATDADADADTDADGDADSDPEEDWRFVDAGSFWDDGSVEIEGPCDDDCAYVYDLVDLERNDYAGQCRFELHPGPAGQVHATGVDSYRFIIWRQGWSNYALYRQRLLADWILEEGSHDLIAVDATVYNLWGDTERLKRFRIAWDEQAHLLTATITSADRTWTRTLAASEAPLVMWNLREFPLEGHGNASPLFAFLLGGRYDWTAGGTQWIEVFSPEQERLERVAVSRAAAPDTLVLHYPVDLALPPYESDSLTWDRNAVEIEYAHGIPVRFGSRRATQVTPVSAPPFELNLPGLEEGTPTALPAPLGGYATSEIEVTSGAVTLAGVVDTPPGAGPHPAVVLLPGWDRATRLGEVGAVDLFAQAADRLAAAGFLVARFDARGTGGSGGALEDALLQDLIDDGLAAVEAVRALPAADGAHVFVLARGHGARVAAAVAADPVAGVAGAILLAPLAGDFAAAADDLRAWYLEPFGFHEQFVIEQQFAEMDFMGDLEDDTYDGDHFRGHSVAAWRSLLDDDWIGSPLALPPTLLVRGTEDLLVDGPSVTALRDALTTAGTAVTRLELDGLSHALTPGTRSGGWPEHGSAEGIAAAAVDALVGWLDDQTGGGL
jgi:dienelactone hydrolase